MPIYAYRCTACGHAKDVLQRMSDPLLTVCPACGAPSFEKQVTAAGFQLKGSGWYVTDFKDGAKPAAGKPDAPKPDAGAGAGAAAKPAAAPADSKAASPAPAPATAPPAKPTAPATGVK